eukprot:MONOS_2674.1-p1 / transcript=MONOS_2674.1 / gene=MONOS_2674 / organism=Monocercomonoides_exilis_PA203 / gene_product=glycerol-3-phosphate O-acyltransferase [EC:2.3.1.15] / transcript_product=glycerol-3-phosphate O-acyltransferase [EC:2.3.1.15] / location=Mono_scaffold00056:82044-83961(-) / protein_length=431 / sequence_SO=supercontig / SO=protein_coding / is_pseudo=false
MDQSQNDRRTTWPMGIDLSDEKVMSAVVQENLYTSPPPTDAYNIFLSGLSFVRNGLQVVVEVLFCFLVLGNVFFAIVFTTIAPIPKSDSKTKFERWLIRQYGGMWLATFSSVVKVHGHLPTHKPNMIYVSNHTSIMDYMLLTTQETFGTVGQQYGGVLGFLQSKVIACVDNIWFDRSVNQEKGLVSKRIKDHINDPTKSRLLIFPEGTCVNNKYCIMFKKGAFEIGATVVPIAIKYHKLFADPFFNSRKMTFWGYCINLMRSWLLYADVWYLPPQQQKEGESVVEFADRVKLMICEKAHLKPTSWDGYLKHYSPSPRFMDEKQQRFCQEMTKELLTDPEMEKILSPPATSSTDKRFLSQKEEIALSPNCVRKQKELENEKDENSERNSEKCEEMTNHQKSKGISEEPYEEYEQIAIKNRKRKKKEAGSDE